MKASQQRRVEMLLRIFKIRYFEEAVKKQQQLGQVPGSVHLSIGHEATIVGASMALGKDDFVIGNHRSHGHPIAKGANLPPLMAELFGKATGVCKGKGGSMHLADREVGVVGESGIVGAGLPLAVGAGLSAKVRGTDQVSLCFFGDGASSEGSFHESLNLASIWDLPVVFVCENNMYGATSPAREVIAVEDIADRAAGYDMPSEIVDGQDADAVYEAVNCAVVRARKGSGPSLVECKTYRFGEHAEGLIIPVPYRDSEEVERWKQRDPVDLYRDRLIRGGVLSESQADDLAEQAGKLVDEAVFFARDSEFPDPAEAFTDIFKMPSAGQFEERGHE